MTKNDLIKVRVSLLEYARHTGFEATESLRILDAALAVEPQQPVGYWNNNHSFIPASEIDGIPNWSDYYPVPLYRAAPPSREWQSLSLTEMHEIRRRNGHNIAGILLDADAALRAKNEVNHE